MSNYRSTLDTTTTTYTAVGEQSYSTQQSATAGKASGTAVKGTQEAASVLTNPDLPPTSKPEPSGKPATDGAFVRTGTVASSKGPPPQPVAVTPFTQDSFTALLQRLKGPQAPAQAEEAGGLLAAAKGKLANLVRDFFYGVKLEQAREGENTEAVVNRFYGELFTADRSYTQQDAKLGASLITAFLKLQDEGSSGLVEQRLAEVERTLGANIDKYFPGYSSSDPAVSGPAHAKLRAQVYAHTLLELSQQVMKDPNSLGGIVIVDKETFNEAMTLVTSAPESFDGKDYPRLVGMLGSDDAVRTMQRKMRGAFNSYGKTPIWQQLRQQSLRTGAVTVQPVAPKAQSAASAATAASPAGGSVQSPTPKRETSTATPKATASGMQASEPAIPTTASSPVATSTNGDSIATGPRPSRWDGALDRAVAQAALSDGLPTVEVSALQLPTNALVAGITSSSSGLSSFTDAYLQTYSGLNLGWQLATGSNPHSELEAMLSAEALAGLNVDLSYGDPYAAVATEDANLSDTLKRADGLIQGGKDAKRQADKDAKGARQEATRDANAMNGLLDEAKAQVEDAAYARTESVRAEAAKDESASQKLADGSPTGGPRRSADARPYARRS